MKQQLNKTTNLKKKQKETYRQKVKKITAKKVDLSDEVMKLIETDQIKMKPSWYFILGSSLMMIGLTIFFILAAFFFNHFFFHLFNTGVADFWNMPGFSHVVWQIFPWWSLPAAILFLALGAWMVHQYDIAYKKSYKLIVLILFLSALALGFILNFLGFNHILIRRRMFHGMYYQKRLGQSWLLGKVVRIESNKKEIAVKVNGRVLKLKYSQQTKMPRRRIMVGDSIKAIGQFTDNHQQVFEAKIIGFRHFRQ